MYVKYIMDVHSDKNDNTLLDSTFIKLNLVYQIKNCLFVRLLSK